MSGTQFLTPDFRPVDPATVGSSSSNTLTALGTTRATGLQLFSRVNNVTTAAASTGVVLPPGNPGSRVLIFHNGVSNIKVYGFGADTIDGVAAATGVTLTAGARCEYVCVATGVIISALMGAVSA